MKEALKKIGEVLVILCIMLMIPVLVHFFSLSKKSAQSEITSRAASTAIPVEAKKSENFFPSWSNIEPYSLYLLGVMFIISILSFSKYKLDKEIHEQKR